MKFKDWANSIISNKVVCDEYKQRYLTARSKQDVFDMLIDANGAEYLCKIQQDGYPLPYEIISSELEPFINGRYIAEYKNDKGNGYTSALYCCYANYVINVDTTITCVMGGEHEISIAPNDFVRVYADKETKLRIICPPTSRCIVETWGVVECDSSNVEVVLHND